MADNGTLQSGTLATLPAGTVIAWDDVAVNGGSSGATQYVKLVDGTANGTAGIPGDATNGLDVDVTRIVPGTSATHLGKAEDAVAGSGDTGVMLLAVRRDAFTSDAADGDYHAIHVDSIGRLQIAPPSRLVLISTPTNSSGLTTGSTNYSNGDVLGAGWVVANAANASGGTGTIVGVNMMDYSDIVSTLTLFFFQGSVTFGTDNSAPSISDADSLKMVGEPVAMTFYDLGGVRVAGTGSISIPYVLDGTDLYVYARADSITAAFFGAATDLKLRVAVRPE